MSGLLQPDDGEILLSGRPVRLKSPRDGIEAGIGMVHQHFMLIPPLTVAENVVLGHEPSKGFFDRTAAERKVFELSEAFGLKLDPRHPGAVVVGWSAAARGNPQDTLLGLGNTDLR